MNLLLFTDADKTSAGELRITGPRLQHIIEVHRAKEGDSIKVGELGGDMGLGTIETLGEDAATIRYTLDSPPPEKSPIHLVLALPRPKMLRRILRSIAEFGIPTLHLINSYRVEKSYWQTPVLDPATTRDYLIQGLEQSRDTVLPSVQLHKRFKPFVEDSLPSLMEGRTSLLAHPGEYPPMPYGPCGNALLIIGPEGGFIPYEVDKLQQAGAQTRSLGSRILRVENAVSHILGRLN